ncbi:MAG: DUF4290 domain-containing protein [Tannerella sp.]|jgi:hypothetical protein|nr:DUF4290 domain-containing protein [Tannerella sp.]
MIYNTQEEPLKLPEYGRNIQHMVDYCLTLKDSVERNRCAGAIIAVMGSMFPHLRDVNDFKHILWDHLAIMSDFHLDVDYPYVLIQKENLYRRPAPVPYADTGIIYKHYGQILERLIFIAKGMPEGEEKEVLLHQITAQMKKSFLVWNKDSVDNRKILKDLYVLSEGQIARYEETFKIGDVSVDVKEIQQQQLANNKKKKKKPKMR